MPCWLSVKLLVSYLYHYECFFNVNITPTFNLTGKHIRCSHLDCFICCFLVYFFCAPYHLIDVFDVDFPDIMDEVENDETVPEGEAVFTDL